MQGCAFIGILHWSFTDATILKMKIVHARMRIHCHLVLKFYQCNALEYEDNFEDEDDLEDVDCMRKHAPEQLIVGEE